MRSQSEDAVPRVAVDVSDRRAYDAALRDFYHPRYHDEKAEPARRAAERILPIVLSLVDATSIVDVGCGPGSWLHVARRLGVSELTGIEGEWAAEWFPHEPTTADPFELIYANLEDELRLPGVFDLAICIEVIEHLSPIRGESFIAELCRCAPHVLFGAALPGQRGPNHLNTQWPSYWAACFATHGFRPLDVVRARVWGDDDLLVHYRQNPIMFVREDVYDVAAVRTAALAPLPVAALDVVHPSLFMRRSNELRAATAPLGLRRRAQIAAGIPRAVVQRLRPRRASG